MYMYSDLHDVSFCSVFYIGITHGGAHHSTTNWNAKAVKLTGKSELFELYANNKKKYSARQFCNWDDLLEYYT